jgi:hypothetical protein
MAVSADPGGSRLTELAPLQELQFDTIASWLRNRQTLQLRY